MFLSYEELRNENLSLRKENRELRGIIAELRHENETLKARFERLEGQLLKLQKENKELRAQINNKDDPPPFVKPPRQKEGAKKPGSKKGHRGMFRAIPSHVNEERKLTLECCPHCGSKLSEPQEERDRYVEDLVPPRLHVTKYRIERYYCPRCKRLVEKKPDDVLPGCQLGIRLMSYVVYLREEMRLPVNMVQRYLARVKVTVSQGEIERICTVAAEHSLPLYEGYQDDLRTSETVNMDETGMRVNGENNWLWTGVTKDPDAVVFKNDEHRSSAVVKDLLGDDFSGVLGSDFYSAYNPSNARKQRCWAHLLRETRKFESAEGKRLHTCLKRTRERASRWVDEQQARASPAIREETAFQYEQELVDLSQQEWNDLDCQRIAKRLVRHSGEFFNYVACPGVEATNNRAERALRPYVVKRKISGGHRSWKGAGKHAILMSVLATCGLRGENFRNTIEGALRQTVASAS